MNNTTKLLNKNGSEVLTNNSKFENILIDYDSLTELKSILSSLSISGLNKSKKKSTNIKHSNIEPFIEKIRFNISDVLSNDNTGLPLIPGIYFVQKTTYTPDFITHPLSENINNKVYQYDNIGTEAITKYYNIKNSLSKLETIKNFIISIIKTNKKLFESIKISQKKYKLTKDNVFYNFKEKLNDNFISIFGSYSENIRKLTKIKGKENNTVSFYKDKDVFKITIYVLIRALAKNNYNLLKKRNKLSDPKDPDFIYIFQNEFNKKSKSYFFKLFQEYKKEREKLIKYILNDYGLLAFHFIFDLKYKLSKPNIIINPNENIENYIIIDKEANTDSNKKYNIGDVLYSDNTYSNKIGYIYSIDYFKDIPYTIKKSDNTFAYENNITKYYIKNKIKPSLQEKINNFNLLYKNLISNESIISDYKKNINNIYSDFYKSLNNYFNENSENNLYDVITNNLDLEINLFKFIFNYVDMGIFNRAVEINYKVKKYIDNKIIDFENKYESYILLFNTINNVISNENYYNNNLNSLDFSNFLTNIINELYKENNYNNNKDNYMKNFIPLLKDKLKKLANEINNNSEKSKSKTEINSIKNNILITPNFIGILKDKFIKFYNELNKNNKDLNIYNSKLNIT